MRTTSFLFLLSLSWIGLNALAQSGKVPAFKIVQSNGKVFQARDLPMNKPILIVYFSPDCDHCQTFMQELLNRTADFKKASIVLITFLAVDKVEKFVKDYNISQHSNIYAGTEGTSFFVRNYYKIRDMPFAALYDKGGHFICSYEKDVPFEELAGKVRKTAVKI
ncbi:MAG: redoxin domain-containing protein [Chitinophagaceae bacterium]